MQADTEKVSTNRLNKVSPGSDQLYNWGGAEGAPRGYPGPSAPPQCWGFGAAKPPQTPTQKCKVRKNLVLQKKNLTRTTTTNHRPLGACCRRSSGCPDHCLKVYCFRAYDSAADNTRTA